MEIKGIKYALVLALALTLTNPSGSAWALEAEELVPVGSAVGIDLETEGVVIVGFSEVETDAGAVSPAAEAGLMEGDVILRVGPRPTDTAAAFLSAMGAADGSALDVTARRHGREVHVLVTPAQSREGGYQLGLWLRDGVSGIGTVTFFDPETGVFGALGHGINDLESGELLPFDNGCITGAAVVDVIPGAAGAPGELCGRFDREDVLGTLEKNTDRGVFGTMRLPGGGAPVPVAGEDEIRLGPAVIRSNVRGAEVRDYQVEISRIYHGAADNRFLLLTVTDPELIAVTGGIVQGMSGSPILQNGKLVGALTHVLLSDPLRGYGISIQRMLEAA